MMLTLFSIFVRWLRLSRVRALKISDASFESFESVSSISLFSNERFGIVIADATDNESGIFSALRARASESWSDHREETERTHSSIEIALAHDSHPASARARRQAPTVPERRGKRQPINLIEVFS